MYQLFTPHPKNNLIFNIRAGAEKSKFENFANFPKQDQLLSWRSIISIQAPVVCCFFLRVYQLETFFYIIKYGV